MASSAWWDGRNEFASHTSEIEAQKWNEEELHWWPKRNRERYLTWKVPLCVPITREDADFWRLVRADMKRRRAGVFSRMVENEMKVRK